MNTLTYLEGYRDVCCYLIRAHGNDELKNYDTLGATGCGVTIPVLQHFKPYV
jgi:hypothetical protein